MLAVIVESGDSPARWINANPPDDMTTKPAFFVGIGGSGMMPLAMILAARGATVAGSDRSLDQARLPAKFDYLRDLGVELFPQDGSGVVSPDQIVVASAAIENSVADIVAAERLGCERRTRAEMLAELFNGSTMPIGVAGTSGKSTVTGMIGWILRACDRDPTVMNGAVMKNFATPNAPFASALVGHGDAFVSEVDESDGSIALFTPRVAVLNNVSLDHKSLEELNQLFGAFIAKAELAVINLDNPDAAALADTLPARQVVGFAIDRDAKYTARDIEERPYGVNFTLAVADHDPLPVELQVPGRHNICNALAAIAAAHSAGVALDEAVLAIAGFTGLRRRFDLVGETRGVTVLDDFGHNPDKIAATLATLHAFPGRLLVLFQPHGYGPLKVMRREMVDAFAGGFTPGDVLILPDPAYYGGTVSREVTSADIAADLVAKGCDARHIADRAEAAERIATIAQSGDRVIVMGARDDHTEPGRGRHLGDDRRAVRRTKDRNVHLDKCAIEPRLAAIGGLLRQSGAGGQHPISTRLRIGDCSAISPARPSRIRSKVRQDQLTGHCAARNPASRNPRGPAIRPAWRPACRTWRTCRSICSARPWPRVRGIS